MATRLSTYDFTKTSNITSSDRMNYPWNDWFDGSIWRIEQGVDFKTHPLMMERIIRTRATARHAKLVLRHEPVADNPFGTIVFRRTDVAQPTWVEVPPVKRTKAEKAKANEQFALVDGQNNGEAHHTVARSKRPVRPS